MKDYFNPNKYRLIQTKTKIFPKNKNSNNQNLYFNLYPQKRQIEHNEYNSNPNSYQINDNFIQYNPSTVQGTTYIPFNVINNNISTNDRIYQKYFYINQRNTPLNNYKTNHANTTIRFNSQNKNKVQQNENARSPIPDIIENENFDFYIKERLNNNRRKNLEETNFMNKTTGFKFLNNNMEINNRTNFSGFYNGNEKDIILKQNTHKNYLNIYRNKIAKNFVRIINKIIEEKKMKNIFQYFLNNLKKIYYIKGIKPNYLNPKYDKEDSKYNEYKDMIYNYIKSKDDLSNSKIYNILKPEDKMKFNTINANRKNNSKFKIKEENYSSNNTSILSEKKSQIQKFKLMQKKYGKIYEKKRNESISFEDRIKNYINSKTIESTSSNNADNNIKRRKIVFKHLKRKDKINHRLNFIEEKTDNTKNDINNININNSNNINKSKNKPVNIHKNVIISKKNKFDSQSSNKSFISISDKKSIYKIYIIKNIITSDKRLYVNINYINLNNHNKKSGNKLYNNDALEISDTIDINYLGGKANKNNLYIHMKKLSKIDEENDEKINTNLSMSIKDENNLKKEENKSIYKKLNKDIRKKYLYRNSNKNTNEKK